MSLRFVQSIISDMLRALRYL